MAYFKSNASKDKDTMRPLFLLKINRFSVWGKKNREEREGKGGKRPFHFSFSSVPRGSTEGLFTGYRICDLIRCVSTPLWLEV